MSDDQDGCEWVTCFFWYRPTWVVPDQWPLNDYVCACVCVPRDTGSIPVRSSDGTTLITDREGILSRWAEHFHGILNQPSTFDPSVLDVIPDWDTAHGLMEPPDIINSFHDGMRAAVIENGEISPDFDVTNGTKQGCVLAPLLFIIFFAMMLRVAF